MRITLKTKGIAVGNLPDGATGEGAELDLPDGATPADAMNAVGIDAAVRYLVMVDGQAVAPSNVSTHPLQDGNVLSLLPPLRGG